MSKRIALVTGGNRGLGLETCNQLGEKGYRVLLGARDAKKGEAAAESLRKKGHDTRFIELDVASDSSIREVVACIEREHGGVDVLVNNAGILPSGRSTQGSKSNESDTFEASVEALRETMETNVYGPLLLCQALVPLMRKRGYGRVVNLSSGMGQLSDMNGGYPAYRISKTAINAVTRIFADETQGQNILVNSVCPGWVKTDMGGEGAELPVEKGADTIVWLATLPDGGPTGGFFREREPIDW